MLEVESKYRSTGNEKVEKSLQKMGADRLSVEDMEDIYFQHPDRDFGETDEALRLRKVGDEGELTYKGPRIELEHSKAREEITVKTADPLAIQRIVERLGFKEFIVIRKRRVNYLYNKLHIALDDVEGLGRFVELELITEEPNRAEELIEEVRSVLLLERREPETYLELLLKSRT